MDNLKSTFSSRIFISLVLCLLIPVISFAQLPREPAVTDSPVDNIFWASTNVGISTVNNLPAGNLNSTVLHTFGLIDSGIEQFFGLDAGANTRIGLEYGISDRWAAEISRMTFNKVVTVGSKVHLFRQTRSGSTPVDVAVKLSSGINTTPGFAENRSDRLNYFASLMIARKIESFSIQLTPMIAHFNRVPDGFQEQLTGLGILVNYELNDRFALSAEYLPLLGDRNPGTHDAMAAALNINTGGHIFQIFIASSQWHNEQFIMANNRDKFWEGEFRIGFNIHRVFGLRN